MIVNRRTYRVKPERRAEFIGLMRELEAAFREVGFSGAFRIYVSNMGTLNQVAMEVEYESLAALEENLAQFGARPTTPALAKKWSESHEGGINEVWYVPD